MGTAPSLTTVWSENVSTRASDQSIHHIVSYDISVVQYRVPGTVPTCRHGHGLTLPPSLQSLCSQISLAACAHVFFKALAFIGTNICGVYAALVVGSCQCRSSKIMPLHCITSETLFGNDDIRIFKYSESRLASGPLVPPSLAAVRCLELRAREKNTCRPIPCLLRHAAGAYRHMEIGAPQAREPDIGRHYKRQMPERPKRA